MRTIAAHGRLFHELAKDTDQSIIFEYNHRSCLAIALCDDVLHVKDQLCRVRRTGFDNASTIFGIPDNKSAWSASRMHSNIAQGQPTKASRATLPA